MELTADESLSRKTGFSVGSEIYYIQRLHFLDGIPLIINHNYFLKSSSYGLTKEIAEDSLLRANSSHDNCQQPPHHDRRKNHRD
jgi:GntR family trehalose operon transcriptional repressor